MLKALSRCSIIIINIIYYPFIAYSFVVIYTNPLLKDTAL